VFYVLQRESFRSSINVQLPEVQLLEWEGGNVLDDEEDERSSMSFRSSTTM